MSKINFKRGSGAEFASTDARLQDENFLRENPELSDPKGGSIFSFSKPSKTQSLHLTSKLDFLTL